VTEMREEAEYSLFKESMLEELRQHRLVIVQSGQQPDGQPAQIPRVLSESCQLFKLGEIGLFFNNHRVPDKLLSQLFKRIRFSSNDAAYYKLVTRVHVSNSDVSRLCMEELQYLLQNEECSLVSLDLSFTQVDGFGIVQSLKSNRSLTALDLMNVPKIQTMYESICTLLNDGSSKTKLGYLRCDAFDLHEGKRSLVLKEEPISAVAMRLLAALLRNNNALTELDLTACDVEKEGVSALAKVLEFNSALSVLRLNYNPAIDEPTKHVLREAVSKFRPTMTLDV